MAHEYTLSAFGLKLIKAYEGFRPVETTLVSGQRVIGYGHRYSPDEEAVVSRAKAERILKEDLAAYEALVNENVFAPLSQSQFDALVSLAFNIGPRAFLSSNTLHALNNGRPLDAANGFDEWRMSTIENKVYVVDALVRRRTAEKALFLRPAAGIVHSPRHEVPPQQDRSFTGAITDTPVFNKEDASGIVDQAPYDAQKAQFRRRDDGPAGILTLSEIEQPFDAPDTPDTPFDEPAATSHADKNLSPIAAAAAELGDRLDQLIADTPDTHNNKDGHDEAIASSVTHKEQGDIEIEAQNIDSLDGAHTSAIKQDIEAANDGAHEDYRRPAKSKTVQTRGPDAFIQTNNNQAINAQQTDRFGAYWISLFVGATLLGGGATKWFLAPNGLDKVSAFAAPVATIVGAMVVLGALYYLLKAIARNSQEGP